MIYRLEIENFFSVRDAAVIDLRVAASVPELHGRFEPIFRGSVERAPKVVAFFGPNASGKSTVLKAIAFLAWFARDSFQLPESKALPCERFNDVASAARLTRLAIEFGGALGSDEVPGTFRYELAIQSNSGAPRKIASEALRERTRGEGKWKRLFERDAAGHVLAGKGFDLTDYRSLTEKIPGNVSLVAMLAQLKHGPSIRLRDAAANIHTNIFVDRIDVPDDQLVRWYGANPALVSRLNDEITRFDLGIRKMEIRNTVGGPQAFFEHEGLAIPMPWGLESHGTRSFIRSFPLLSEALRCGGVAVVDEIDIAIHPLVLPEIVRWFHDPGRNPNGAQLWMACHNASLLEDLEKEEVFFCEKDTLGRTRVYGLQDIKSVRRLDNRYRKYLGGIYGAVPRIG